MSLVQIAWPTVRSVIASALPNLLVLMLVVANFVWLARVGPLGGPLGGPYFNLEQVWLESFLTVGAVIAIDILAISLFALRWRARRWDRKPLEIERATRYDSANHFGV